MTWGAPFWLWALAAPGLGAALLLASLVWRRKAGDIRWPGIRRVVAAGSRLLDVAAGSATRRPWLLLLALSIAILALARPRWGQIEKPVMQQAREVMLALDLSRSMLVEDVPPTRLARTRLLLQGLLDGLRGERVGLIVFAGTAFVQVPLSADYQILQEFLPALNPDYMPQGGTDFEGMLRAAAGGFSETANTDRYLIVLSDGEALDDSWRNQLADLKKRGVHVIALGVGTPGGGFIPDKPSGFVKDERGAVVLSRLETGTLRALAHETGGVYRDASSWVDLAALLQETVERGRQGDFTEEKTVDVIERFQWFLAPAVLIAMLGLWREILVRPKPRTVRRPSARAVAKAALVLFVLQVWIPRSGAATAPADTSPAGQVRATIARLATHPNAAAADWKELAERTLAYGATTRSANQPVEPGAVTDALSAVEIGRTMEPLLANWDQLREDLEKLLEKPTPPPQQDQQDQKQDESQNDEPKKDEQSKDSASDQAKSDPKNEQSEGGKEDGQRDEGKSDENQKPESGEQSGEPESNDDSKGRQPESRPQPASDEGELGEMKEEPEPADGAPENQPPQQPRTRKIGGRPADADSPPPSSPEMAAALQRLRQVTDGDSPARLFELLEGENKPAKPTGKDW